MALFFLACAASAPPDSVDVADQQGYVDSGLCADTGSLRHEDTGGVDSATDIPSDTGLVHPPDSTTTPAEDLIIYAVRHAEKASDSSDPGLTEEGTARAEALALLMTDVSLAAIYATDLRRTQDTVRPTADDHGLPIVTDIDPEEDLAAWIQCTHGGDIVLHAGHSYTLPGFFVALGLPEPPDVDGYGQLFKLHFYGAGAVTVEESRYGD